MKKSLACTVLAGLLMGGVMTGAEAHLSKITMKGPIWADHLVSLL